MKKTFARSIGLLALVALISLAGPAEAQQRRPGQRPDRPEMEAQVRQRFQQMVFRELALTREQGEAMGRVVEEMQEPRRELNQRQRMLQRRMAGTGALLSEAEASAVLEELLAVREAETRLVREEQERLLEILSPPQLVRFYTLRERFAARIRQLRENRGGGPGAPGPGGGGTLDIWPLLEE